MTERKPKDIHVLIPENMEYEIEKEHHRLDQELIRLKEKGVKSKRAKLTRAAVRRVALKIGIEKVRELDYLSFEKLK